MIIPRELSYINHLYDLFGKWQIYFLLIMPLLSSPYNIRSSRVIFLRTYNRNLSTLFYRASYFPGMNYNDLLYQGIFCLWTSQTPLLLPSSFSASIFIVNWTVLHSSGVCSPFRNLLNGLYLCLHNNWNWCDSNIYLYCNKRTYPLIALPFWYLYFLLYNSTKWYE